MSNRLHGYVVSVFATGLVAAGCASSWPPPNDRLASSEASVRGAEEVGAANQPRAALHLRLAQEGIAAARASMRDGENKRADYLLMRASAEADLALVEAKAASARVEAQKARGEVDELRQSGR